MPAVIARRAAARAGALAGALALVTAPSAAARTSVGVLPSVQPYELGAHASAVVSLHFYDRAGGVPAPLRGAVLRLPAGLRVELAGVATCPLARVRRSASRCPAASLIGRGTATLEVHAGSQTVPESATIALVRTPDAAGHPTFAIVGRGSTPLLETIVSTAALLHDDSPYGSKLVVSVPPIPTLQYEPNASFSALSLTIGETADARAPIVLPRRCPVGGFAFAATFSFADGTTAGESGQLPCPGSKRL